LDAFADGSGACAARRAAQSDNVMTMAIRRIEETPMK
jgi:hypothetical protein